MSEVWSSCGCVKKRRKNWNTADNLKKIFDKTNGKCCHCSQDLVFERRRLADGVGAWEIEHYIELARHPKHEEYDVYVNLFAAHVECNGHHKKQGHYDQPLELVFDLKDDSQWPFGFKPHPNLKLYLATTTAINKCEKIEKITNLEETLEELNLEVWVPSEEILSLELTDNHGAHGIIHKGIYKGQQVAIKTWNTKRHGTLQNLLTEAKILRNLPSHENVVKFFGVTILPSINKLGVVLEWIPFNLCQESRPNDFDPIKTFRGIASGLQFLHANDIIHRDLKPANILVTATSDAKLCDFGVARDLSLVSDQEHLSDTGTDCYRAPEVRSGRYSYPADIYSLGHVLHYVSNLSHDPESTYEYTQAFGELAERCAKMNVKERISLDDVIAILNGNNLVTSVTPLHQQGPTQAPPQVPQQGVLPQVPQQGTPPQVPQQGVPPQVPQGIPPQAPQQGVQAIVYLVSLESRSYHIREGCYNAKLATLRSAVGLRKQCNRCK